MGPSFLYMKRERRFTVLRKDLHIKLKFVSPRVSIYLIVGFQHYLMVIMYAKSKQLIYIYIMPHLNKLGLQLELELELDSSLEMESEFEFNSTELDFNAKFCQLFIRWVEKWILSTELDKIKEAFQMFIISLHLFILSFFMLYVLLIHYTYFSFYSHYFLNLLCLTILFLLFSHYFLILSPTTFSLIFSHCFLFILSYYTFSTIFSNFSHYFVFLLSYYSFTTFSQYFNDNSIKSRLIYSKNRIGIGI